MSSVGVLFYTILINSSSFYQGLSLNLDIFHYFSWSSLVTYLSIYFTRKHIKLFKLSVKYQSMFCLGVTEYLKYCKHLNFAHCFCRVPYLRHSYDNIPLHKEYFNTLSSSLFYLSFLLLVTFSSVYLSFTSLFIVHPGFSIKSNKKKK